MFKALIILSFCVFYSAGTLHSIAPLFRQKRAYDTCITTSDSRDPGAKCVFPFEFKGKIYNGCGPDIYDATKLWCSTKTDSKGKHISGEGNYGYCTSSCPVHSNIDSSKDVVTAPRSGMYEDLDFGGVDHGECTIVYKDECKPIQVTYKDYETQCTTVEKKCTKTGYGNKFYCMDLYETECKNVPLTKYRFDQHCEKVSYKRCGEDDDLKRLTYEPTDAEDCKIGWRQYHISEYKDTSTKICTTMNERACKKASIESCKFVTIKVPFTEMVEECETQTIKKCAQHWACKDDGWTKESGNPCQEDEYRDDPNSCVELPNTVCTDKEITIDVEKKKRECEDVEYEDCSAKVPTETCTYKKIREPTTFIQSLPHIVCKSCETEYRSIYKTVYELAHVKKCHDMPKKICQYLDEKVCRISRWSHKEICQYETMENCYKKHEEICHSHSHKVPKSEEVIVPKTVCYQSYLGFVEGEK